jgi:hypothetical protein
VSVRESEAITEIAKAARRAEAYNRLYAETLVIARDAAKNKDGLNIFWETV